MALLRAVNVGGTGKLPMKDLKAMCEEAGFASVRTFIASGNAVFKTAQAAPAVKAALEARLATYAGKPVGVVVRTGPEMADVFRKNPFPDSPGNRVTAMFFDEPVSDATLRGVTGQAKDEKLALGHREIYIWYGPGISTSRLRIPAAKSGTARNMNTVARLAEMAAE